MKHFTFQRTFVAAAVAVAGVVGLMPAAASAAPTAAPTSSVTCKKIVGSPVALTATVSGCTSAATGGSGAISNFLPTGGHVVWANSTTTDYTTTPHFVGPGTGGKSCAVTSIEFDLKGKVKASTNPAVPVGSVVKMDVCVNGKGTRITKKPGTAVKF